MTPWCLYFFLDVYNIENHTSTSNRSPSQAWLRGPLKLRRGCTQLHANIVSCYCSKQKRRRQASAIQQLAVGTGDDGALWVRGAAKKRLDVRLDVEVCYMVTERIQVDSPRWAGILRCRHTKRQTNLEPSTALKFPTPSSCSKGLPRIPSWRAIAFLFRKSTTTFAIVQMGRFEVVHFGYSWFCGQLANVVLLCAMI